MTDEVRKARIVAYATARFMALGPSNVTMDEIARGVAMGKATVYRLFSSKEALVEAMVDGVAARVEQEFALITADASNPEARLEALMRVVGGALRSIRPEAMEDMARTMPSVFAHIEQVRRRLITGNLTGLLAAGKAEGYFRGDLDVRLATQVLIGAVTHLTSPGVLGAQPYPPEQLFRALISQLAEGWRKR